jgi:transaldolase
VRALSRDGVNINMTAIFTSDQVARAVDALAGGAPACVSVFPAGCRFRHRLSADHARRGRARPKTQNVEIIWASTREAFNAQADEIGTTSSRRRPIS